MAIYESNDNSEASWSDIDLDTIARTRFPIVNRGFDQDSVLAFLSQIIAQIEAVCQHEEARRDEMIASARREADLIRSRAVDDAWRISALVQKIIAEVANSGLVPSVDTDARGSHENLAA